jgi:hypothetical protein
MPFHHDRRETMQRRRSLQTLATIGLSAALLWGCGEQAQDTGDEQVSEEVSEAVEETREAARAAAEQVGETTSEAVDEAQQAVEQTGDRIESATD